MSGHGWALLGLIVGCPVVLALGVAYVRASLAGGVGQD